MHHNSLRAAARLARALGLIAVSLIAACGGGGGGGGGGSGSSSSGGSSSGSQTLSITLSPATVSASFYPGHSYSFDETATVQGSVSGAVFVLITDKAGVLQPNASVQQQGNGTYLAHLSTISTLAVGHHTGTIGVRACGDAACSQVYASTTLGYDFTVLAGPSISTLSPAGSTAGTAAFALTANGAGFNSTSTLTWNGSPRPTTLVSATQLTAQIAATDIAAIGTDQVGISNAADQGGASATVGFNVVNPKPALTSLSPGSIPPGQVNAFLITIAGTGFIQNSSVLWNGSSRPTTYVAPTQLVVQIEAADVAVGTNPSETVTVSNPAPGGGVSNTLTFSLSNPVPAIAVLNNGEAAAGCGAFTLYVIGDNLTPTSTVLWNGSPHPTTLIRGGLALAAQISAADIATAGSANVTVSNPKPDGGTSGSLPFTIDARGLPTTDAVAYQNNAAHNGFATTTCPVSLPAASSWSHSFSSPLLPTYPLIAAGHVYVTFGSFSNGSHYALDQKTGNLSWGPLGGGGGTVYDAGSLISLSSGLPTEGAQVDASVEILDAATGAATNATDLPGMYFVYGATALDGRVYATASSNDASQSALFAVDDSTGKIAWNQPIISGSPSHPAVTADGIYIADGCQQYDFKPEDGSINWHNGNCPGGAGSIPLIANGRMYAAQGGGESLGNVLDALTGSSLSTYNANAMPAVTDNGAYYVFNGVLIAYDINGTLRWSAAPGGAGYNTSPIVVNHTIFAATADGELDAIDATTGRQLWVQQLGASISDGSNDPASALAALVAGDNLLVVPTFKPGTGPNSTFTAFTIASPAPALPSPTVSPAEPRGSLRAVP